MIIMTTIAPLITLVCICTPNYRQSPSISSSFLIHELLVVPFEFLSPAKATQVKNYLNLSRVKIGWKGLFKK